MNLSLPAFARPAVVSLSIALLSSAATVIADDGPHDKAIKARQAMFQTYAFSTGLLGAMAKEEIPYDAEIAMEAAANLEAAANFGQSQFWPQGSDNETEGNAKNRALPVIWETFPDIVEKADQLKEAAAAMAAVAGDGLDALQGAMGDVGGSCKACHDDFRASRK
jgi:cytochrome c556